MRFLIRQVRGAQPFQAALIILKAPREKLIEIEQVSDIFLNRPLVAVAPRKQSRRHIPHSLFDPRGRTAQPFDDLRVQLDGKAEIEFAVEPKRPDHTRSSSTSIQMRRESAWIRQSRPTFIPEESVR